MFILRRVALGMGQVNTSLGDYYTLILKETEREFFEETVKLWDKDIVEKVYGVIVFDDDNGYIMPLYLGSNYYLMGSDGRTFDNISYK